MVGHWVRKCRELYILLSLILLAGCSDGSAEGSKYVIGETPVKAEVVLSGLDVPWGMTFISARELLITERRGTIQKANLDTGELVAIAGVPAVLAKGQGGLLDIAASPHYAEDGWLYFTFAKDLDGKAATSLARAKLEGNSLVAVEELFVSKHQSDAQVHFGSRVVFDGEGHLFFGHGDRGERDDAQKLGDHAGKIFRLNLDGSIPEDNPFVGRADAQPEIWSYGHRNPQGLAFDPATQRVWAIEHGPRGGDEINLIERGKNYGWPVISFGQEYLAPVAVGEGTAKKGMEQPIQHYVPSIAPSSLMFYTGDHYPGWQGSLFAGALALMHLNRIVLDDNGQAIRQERYLTELQERIRNVVQGPDGKLYLATDTGKIMVLENS